jgi:hypothetical protein
VQSNTQESKDVLQNFVFWNESNSEKEKRKQDNPGKTKRLFWWRLLMLCCEGRRGRAELESLRYMERQTGKVLGMGRDKKCEDKKKLWILWA